MNNQTVADRFAQGKTKAKGSNLFIDGNAIYSYGYHFPIAVRYEGGYLWNRDRYSNSTAKHKNHVGRALNYQRIAELDTACLKDIVKWGKLSVNSKHELLKQLASEAKTANEKSRRARKQSMRDFWVSEFNELLLNSKKVSDLPVLEPFTSEYPL